jgi:hypothetical protein
MAQVSGKEGTAMTYLSKALFALLIIPFFLNTAYRFYPHDGIRVRRHSMGISCKEITPG